MAELCTDNRFEIIEKYKNALIECTNIETSPDEMKVIDNVLFRFWQMGWLEKLETADVVEIKKEGEWEMFNLISSAYYGKGMYFKQDNGTVYSRYTGKYMSVDEAIREFVSLIDDSDLP